MIVEFFPWKKLRRNSRYLLFGAILLVGIFAFYHETVAAKAWSSDTGMKVDAGGSWGGAMFDRARKDNQPVSTEDSAAWRSSFNPQTWKPEYKGKANMHVFEDWCGSSTADLSKNLHYPLYAHSRTTVQKLAVTPKWTNYGLRIFGYIHPYTDGTTCRLSSTSWEFVFALSSDDNSEFWLSTDDSPLNLQLLAWVGKTGKEWTAPGEFEKYASQTSRPVWLSAQGRYFFEVIHKQNDRGTDHVEVAWQLTDHDSRFMVIESRHISLYVDESALLMSDIAHIPQTDASHQRSPAKQSSVAADMLREDLRDTLYKVPLMNSKLLQGVLPDCSYNPSYTIKDFPLMRYQGLQFVHLSYIYPNDYTRLTHMETEKSCFYQDSPYYRKMFGFSRYMRLDGPEKENIGMDFGFQKRKAEQDEEDEFDFEAYQREKEARRGQIDNALFPDYGDDFDDYIQRRRRKLFSLGNQESNYALKNASVTRLRVPKTQPVAQQPAEPLQVVPMQSSKQVKPKMNPKRVKRKKLKLVKKPVRQIQKNVTIPVGRPKRKKKERAVRVKSEQLNPKQLQIPKSHKMNDTQIQRIKNVNLRPVKRDVPFLETPKVAKQWKNEIEKGAMELNQTPSMRSTTPKREHPLVRPNQSGRYRRKHLRDMDVLMNVTLQKDLDNSIHRAKIITSGKKDTKWSDTNRGEEQVGDEDEVQNRAVVRKETVEMEKDSLWGGDFEGMDDEDSTPAPVFDPEINWNQTFQVSPLDLQAKRSDWIDLHCNISGNLLFQASEAMPMVEAFMEQLNNRHHGQYTLVRVVNVVKRVDTIQGNRYLLELELKDVHGHLLRLSHYIYALIRHSGLSEDNFDYHQPKPQPKPQQVLCNPVGFRWNPTATVHFIVPVKNQARWVQQLISDMEQLFRETGDINFNLIIADYNSTDMDVRSALQKSKLFRYQYVKLAGNFERSAGLQAGINLIDNDHSIVFLCDLHIHFPPSIIDTIRQHCVEGYMAFAPIVLRLDCGSTPAEPRGYWEVNGFGLLGIYKSDLDAVGGMNTKEFTNRWGGEDWELLDRILQGGLEVERIYLRNFFHRFHSKRGMWNRQMIPSNR
ncbi:beta-1,4-N-acetylgalactosaminyltransferase 3 isoform X1 [Labrus mixtus]|uniref:beta-1,4-N-acetylgalactosaminyltransferase 3 isoform X1 n=2 Tax=Labrus mixtus TaxID=508554 RepID=UPI0029C0F72A|nr:beta-1,4-N-acetylgalactosaminyltransferase 3 isoform X1 [Labrus mixtus]